MQEHKVAFIICANNDLYCDECIWYINHINVPKGYEVDIIKITEAESMAEAYNAAIMGSDAKYKVYLHQDVFIYHQNFIEDMIKIFESDKELGMLGVFGGVELPANAITFVAWNKGNVAVCDYHRAYNVTFDTYNGAGNTWVEVDAIDGMLMATQYDIKWREDLGLGWDFYDVSQSLEFRRRGYKVGVAAQAEPWCMHDCGSSKLDSYDISRELILKEYTDFFAWDGEFVPCYHREFYGLISRLVDYMVVYIMNWNLEGALEIQNKINDIPVKGLRGTSKFFYARNILEICSAEKKQDIQEVFIEKNMTEWDQVVAKYDSVKLVLRHIEKGISTQKINALQEQIQAGKISKQAVEIIIMHSIIQKESVLNWLRSI